MSSSSSVRATTETAFCPFLAAAAFDTGADGAGVDEINDQFLFKKTRMLIFSGVRLQHRCSVTHKILKEASNGRLRFGPRSQRAVDLHFSRAPDTPGQLQLHVHAPAWTRMHACTMPARAYLDERSNVHRRER